MAVALAAEISSRTTVRAARQARNNWARFLRTTPLIAFRLPLGPATDRDIAWSADSARPTRLSRQTRRLFRAIDTDLLQSPPDIRLKQVSCEFLAPVRQRSDQALSLQQWRR